MNQHFSFGDSQVDPVSFGAGNGKICIAWRTLIKKLAASYQGQAGACAADGMQRVWGNSPGAGDSASLFYGANDLKGRGAGAAALSVFGGGVQSYMYYLGGTVQTFRGLPSSAYSGTWADTTSVPGSVGRYCATAGGSVTFPFLGDVLALCMLIDDEAPTSSCSLTIDGVSKPAINAAPPCAVTTWYLGQKWTPAMFFNRGNGALSLHTATLAFTAGCILPEWIWLGPSSVPVYAFNMPYQKSPATGTTAEIDAYCGEWASRIAVAQGDGIDVRPIDLKSNINPTTHVDAGGIHLNANGHAVAYGEWPT